MADIHMALGNIKLRNSVIYSSSPINQSNLSLTFSDVSVTYLTAVTGYLTKSLKNVRVSLPCGLRVAAKAQQQGHGAAGHIASSVRKQREMNECYSFVGTKSME